MTDYESIWHSLKERLTEMINESLEILGNTKNTKFYAGKLSAYSEIHRLMLEFERCKLTSVSRLQMSETPETIESSVEGYTIIPITSTKGYYYDEEREEYVIVDLVSGKKLYKWSKKQLEEVWKRLPPVATSGVVTKVASECGVHVSSNINYFMRLFCHVNFDGEIRRKDGQLILIKPNDYSLSEDQRKMLEVEKELVGDLEVD